MADKTVLDQKSGLKLDHKDLGGNVYAPKVYVAGGVATTLPTGAATAEKQDTGNASLALVDTNLGAKADAAATTDAGTFSLIALLKRLLQKLTAGVPVTTLPASSTANTPVIVTAAGEALAANAARKSWAVQNVGTNPLRVRLGGVASSSAFHFVLKGGSADNDGNGAVLSNDVWQGSVSVDGTSPKFTVTELT